MKRSAALLLLALAASAAEPPPLPSPEPLVPADMPVFVRGTGLENLQAHLDAFCNRFPGPASRKVRDVAGPLLGRPFLVAADGARPWGMACAADGSLAFLLPVEDADAFQKALRAGMEGAECRLVRGYALVGRDPALLARLGEDAADPLKPSLLREDLCASLSPEALTLLAARLPGSVPHRARIRALASAVSRQAARLHVGLTLGEEGLGVSARLRPAEGSRLASVLASQKPGALRWAGLASRDAAFLAETRLDAEGWAALLDLAALLRPGSEEALRPFRGIGGGDACLALARGETGWQAQGVLRPSDPERLRGFLDAEVPDWASQLASALGRGLHLSTDALQVREMGSLRLYPFTFTGEVQDASLPPWAGFLPEGPRRVDAGAALCEELLVAAAGPEAHARLQGMAVPLADGLEPRVDPAWSGLLEGLPGEVNGVLLVSLGRLAELASVGWPARLGRIEGCPAAPAALAFRAVDGEAELLAAVPAGTLADLLEFRSRMALAGRKGD